MHLVRGEAVLFAEVLEPRHDGKREGRRFRASRRGPPGHAGPREERENKHQARNAAD